MLYEYQLITKKMGVGMIFRFIVYNYKKDFTISEFIRIIEYWCINNINDNSIYDIVETILGCQVMIYDDVHAMAFKLRWM